MRTQSSRPNFISSEFLVRGANFDSNWMTCSQLWTGSPKAGVGADPLEDKERLLKPRMIAVRNTSHGIIPERQMEQVGFGAGLSAREATQALPPAGSSLARSTSRCSVGRQGNASLRPDQVFGENGHS
jgi:hypothetical protein